MWKIKAKLVPVVVKASDDLLNRKNDFGKFQE